MKDWLLIAGHGQGDPGAIGNGYKESDLTREFATLLKEELEKRGKTVDLYPFSRNAVKSRDVENYKAKQVLEIHFNSFSDPNSNGTETLIHDSYKPDKIDMKIKEVSAKYWRDRGIKGRNNLYVMNRYKAMRVSFRLLEVCFISSAKDMEIYQNNKKQFAMDLAEGITKL